MSNNFTLVCVLLIFVSIRTIEGNGLDFSYLFVSFFLQHGKFSECLYYPGQELKGPLAGLAEAKWLHSTARHCHKAANKKGRTASVQFTIEKVGLTALKLNV